MLAVLHSTVLFVCDLFRGQSVKPVESESAMQSQCSLISLAHLALIAAG